jgi:tetratricopeptide (TPR) repeat protein
MDCLKQNWAKALEHLDTSLRSNADNIRARTLKVIVLRKLGQCSQADSLLKETLALDVLDCWARLLADRPLACNWQTRLDVAHDCARAGLYEEAIGVLSAKAPARADLPDQSWGAEPLVQYTLGWLHEKAGQTEAADACYQEASRLPPDYCFPARLEEIAILNAARARRPGDARALYYLGNLFYDRRRHKEAIRLWQSSVKLDSSYSVVWRNLGIARFNVLRRPEAAAAAYERALAANPNDARLLYERDQLWKRLGRQPSARLRELEQWPRLVSQRDDLAVEMCALYNHTGQHEKALSVLSQRRFQPWEGGEGQVLAQYVRAHLCLGRKAMARDEFSQARSHFENALQPPENLGEARHPLANPSDIHFWLGEACHALNDTKGAKKQWRAAAVFRGDFQEMSVRAFSEMTYYSALAQRRLGQKRRADSLLDEVREWARRLRRTRAKIDYFATSLPAMLFEEDLEFRQETTAIFLEAQALFGLGKITKGSRYLLRVLSRDPNHALALDFSTYEHSQEF